MVAVGRKLVGFVSIAAAAYAVVVRPRLVRWGASDEEVERTYPGVDRFPTAYGRRPWPSRSTRHRPRSGPGSCRWAGTAGWYSWDRLDNGGHASARELHPEWQRLSVGDWLSAWSPGGLMKAWEVVALEANRFLGLRGLMDFRGQVIDATHRDRRPTPKASGVPVGGAAWWSHTPRRRWLPSAAPSLARTIRQLLGLSAGPLDDASASVRELETQCRNQLDIGDRRA